MCELRDAIMLGYLGCCAWSDWKTRELPVHTLLLFSVSTILLTIGGEENIGSIVGGLLMGGVFFLVSKLTKEAIGYGDSWIILLLGIYLGGTKLLWLLFISSFAAGVCSLLYMWKHNWKRDETLPFVPFLMIGFVGVVFL